MSSYLHVCQPTMCKVTGHRPSRKVMSLNLMTVIPLSTYKSSTYSTFKKYVLHVVLLHERERCIFNYYINILIKFYYKHVNGILTTFDTFEDFGGSRKIGYILDY